MIIFMQIVINRCLAEKTRMIKLLLRCLLITAVDDVKSASADKTENTPSIGSDMAVVYICKVIDYVSSGLVEYCQMSQVSCRFFLHLTTSRLPRRLLRASL